MSAVSESASVPVAAATPAASPMRVLSIIPPMTQLNTPYPSTAYLTGFLRARRVDAVQEDFALALVLRLLSESGLRRIRERIEQAAAVEALATTKAGGATSIGQTGQKGPRTAGAVHKVVPVKAPKRPTAVSFFLSEFDRYVATVDRTIAFLQGRDPTLAHRINTRTFLPEGARFATLDAYADDESGDPLAWAFGALGLQDRARHLATLYLNDLADVLREAVDPRFEFVRYAESLSTSQPTFEPLAQALAAPPNLMDEVLVDLTRQALERHRPKLVLLSVPFPGAVYASLRIGQAIKALAPDVAIALGGGFVNTELREMSDPRLFDFVDYVTLDAGERPLLALMEHLQGRRSRERLVRTFVRETTPLKGAEAHVPADVDPTDASVHRSVSGGSDAGAHAGRVRLIQFPEPDIAFAEVGTPTWDGLPLDKYLSLLDMLNPMNRLWSDGRWNKLTVAHGCYWKKCSFCDVSLDYISRYEGASAQVLVDRIEAIVRETGQTGFHFVDEAAPPKALKALAAELQRRHVQISWWGNIRFEKTFTPELAQELADSGCIAMSGGLEVASDRLLQLMNKGVSVEQVARVTKGFADAGILVHAYLMYGFPTQTVQDTVDALEYVRQLFENGCIHSGFFHRFACTVHSPVGLDPQAFGVKLRPLPPVSFAKNDVGFIDPTGTDHDALGQGLKKALYNYMHGMCVDEDVRQWFEHPKLRGKVPKATVNRHRIARALSQA